MRSSRTHIDMSIYPKDPETFGPVYHSEAPIAHVGAAHAEEEAWRAPDLLRSLGRFTIATLGIVGKLINKLDSPISGK